MLFRTWYGVFVALTSLFVALATVISLWLPRLEPLQHAQAVLEQQLSDAIGAPLSTKSVEITSTGSVRLRGVEFGLRSEEAQAKVSADDITVDLSLWRLLRTRSVLTAIRGVRIHSPRVELTGAGTDLARLVHMEGDSTAQGLPFPVRISELSVSWGENSWSERLLTLQPNSTPEHSVRFVSKKSVVSLTALPFPLQVSGTGIADSVGLDKVSLSVAASLGRLHVSGGAGSVVALDVKGSFAGEALAQVMPSWPLLGAGLFEGTVSGSSQAPQVALSVTMPNVALWQRVFKAVKAEVQANASEMTVAEGSATESNSGAVYAFSGKFDWESRQLLAEVESQSLPAGEALAWVNVDWPWEGQVAGELHVTGPLGRLAYDVQIEGARGSAWGQPFENLSVDVGVLAGAVTIRRGAMDVLGGRLSVVGSVADGTVDVTVEPRGIPLTELVSVSAGDELPPVAADALLRVRGPVEKPQVSGTLSVPSLRLDGDLKGECSWLEPEELSGDFELRGSIGDDAITVRLAGSGRGECWLLDRLKVAARGGTADFRGATGSGEQTISGHWNDFSVAFLASLDERLAGMDGRVTGAVELTTRKGIATGSLSWETPLLSVAGSQITNAGGTLELRNGRLYLRDWRGDAAGRTARLDGSLPVPGKMAEILGVKPQGGIDLIASVPKGPLAPLAAWAPLLPAAVREMAAILRNGQAQGELSLQVKGTLEAPLFNGELTVADGRLILPNPWGDVSNISAQVAFKGASVQVERLSGELLGGRLSADGEINWRTLRQPSLVAKVSGSLRPKLPGMEATGDVRLRMSGTLKDPTISGEISVRQGMLDLGALTWGSGGERLPLDPQLNVDLVVNQCRVRANSLLDIPVKGRLRATGRLTEPQLSGRLASDRGRLNYLGTSFVIEETEAEFTPHRGIMPRVRLWGTTWVGRTTIALQLSGIFPDLVARFTSEPPLPQQDILALLEWPGQIAGLNSGDVGLVDVLQTGIAMRLVGEVENAVREGLGLDDFHLEPDLTQRSMRLTLGKSLMPRIYITYEQSLFSEPDGDLSVEYRLDNDWKLSVGLGDGNDLRLGVKAKTRF